MTTSRSSLALPVLLIALGSGWLLTVRGVIPGVDWVWVLGLAVTGVLVLAVGGVNKVTAFVGPYLLICSVAALLRQTGRIVGNEEVPGLVVVAGVLMLVVRWLPLRWPRYVEDARKGG